MTRTEILEKIAGAAFEMPKTLVFWEGYWRCKACAAPAQYLAHDFVHDDECP